MFIGRVGMGITDVLNRTTDMFSALTNLGIPLSGSQDHFRTASLGKPRKSACVNSHNKIVVSYDGIGWHDSLCRFCQRW
ncbi:MAG: hypothetical protein V8Q65_07025 [Bacteroidaceae bacterium]